MTKGHHIAQNSFAYPQQLLPLSKVALETYALSDLQGRDYAPFDLLSALSGTLAN